MCTDSVDSLFVDVGKRLYDGNEGTNEAKRVLNVGHCGCWSLFSYTPISFQDLRFKLLQPLCTTFSHSEK